MLLHDVVAYGVLCNSICFFVPPVLQVCQGASRGRGTVSVPFVWLSISNAQTAKANFMKLVREGGPTEIWSCPDGFKTVRWVAGHEGCVF